MNHSEMQVCALCRRRGSLSFHHLIPRALHANKWFKQRYSRQQMQEGIEVCGDCHAAIHQFIPRKALGRTYNTCDALRAHPELARFIAWASRRSTTGRIRTRAPQR